MTTEPKKTMNDLSQAQLETLKEKEFNISLKGMWKLGKKTAYDFPLSVFKKTVRKIDEVSKTMTTGYAAVITMPLSMVLRNGATVAHEAANADEDSAHAWHIPAHLAGIASAGAAAWFGGGAVYSSLTASLGLTGILGQGAALVVSATVGTFAAIPAFTAGLLLTASTVGVFAAAITLVGPALYNLPTAFARSKAKFKGIEVDEKALKQKLDQNSISARYATAEDKSFQAIQSSISHLPELKQKEILTSLKTRFEKVSVATNDNTATAAQVEPVTKPLSPKS